MEPAQKLTRVDFKTCNLKKGANFRSEPALLNLYLFCIWNLYKSENPEPRELSCLRREVGRTSDTQRLQTLICITTVSNLCQPPVWQPLSTSINLLYGNLCQPLPTSCIPTVSNLSTFVNLCQPPVWQPLSTWSISSMSTGQFVSTCVTIN